MLESTQAVDDETEEPKKDQRSLLIPTLMSARVAIACLDTLRPHEVQPFDQALQRLEILQAVDVLGAYLAASCCHGSHYGNFAPRAQLSPHPSDSLGSLAQMLCRTGVGRERFSRRRFSRRFGAWLPRSEMLPMRRGFLPAQPAARCAGIRR